LDFSFEGRKLLDSQVYTDIGHTVYDLADTAPGGVLVFFASKFELKKCS
jgi:Rad3-related DNA helicase